MGILNAITKAAPVLGLVCAILGATLGSHVKPAALQHLRDFVGASLGRRIFWQFTSTLVCMIFFLTLMSCFRVFQGVFACICMGVIPIIWRAIGAFPAKTGRDDIEG